jgi:hypothetical protein
MTEQSTGGGEVRGFFGFVLLAVGVLWMLASGLCSAGFLVMILTTGGDLREALGILPMILLVGGFSAGIGFTLYVIGRALRPKTK